MSIILEEQAAKPVRTRTRFRQNIKILLNGSIASTITGQRSRLGKIPLLLSEVSGRTFGRTWEVEKNSFVNSARTGTVPKNKRSRLERSALLSGGPGEPDFLGHDDLCVLDRATPGLREPSRRNPPPHVGAPGPTLDQHANHRGGALWALR